MQEIDYERIGFKAGLEIHQQLDTKKLFCNCPSVLRKDEPDFVVERKLHAVAGEGGEIDVAAKHEAEKEKTFVYQGYDTTCLIELDEEPPHEINKEALKIALQISVLLNCKIVPVTQIMRKTVIDGSNTSGFQRTVLIAREGYVESEFGKVGINAVILEEDAARIIEKKGDKTVYKLDRLGIPLIEVVTAPDIKTPEQAKEVGLMIGQILRSCKVRRGIGTIRQDVSVSIKGGERIEMKGVQEPKLIIPTINYELERQMNLVKNKKSVPEVRRGNPDAITSFLRPLPGSARMYPETDLPLLKISREIINDAKKTLPKLKTDVEDELKKDGLSHEMIKLLFKQKKLGEFRELIEIVNSPQLVAKILLIFPKEISSHKKIALEKVEESLNNDVLVFVLESLKDRKISESQTKNVLERIVEGNDLKEAIVFEKEDLGNIEEKILKIIKEKPGLSEKAYMGLVMGELKGKIDGKIASEIIKKLMK
ncbi:MAG: Glu-tRNA(Gln) amidotransferase subunit GatE [Nanoarchaeota archaeon]|nr:Glu-tRNA(Gln) amidotransferase subunit GatE [Nanoarchaeota archaeon]